MSTEIMNTDPEVEVIRLTLTVTKERVMVLIIHALDFGLHGPWGTWLETELPDGFTTPAWVEDPEQWANVRNDYFAPFVEGGAIVFRVDDDDERIIRLDAPAIDRGLKVFAETERQHFADFISEQDDANTADAFLQCCLFGKVEYG